jgi:hypothetical protein
VLQLLDTANVVPSSPILVSLMIGAILSSDTSVLTRATRRNIPEDGNLHSHRREDLKSYMNVYSVVGSAVLMYLATDGDFHMTLTQLMKNVQLFDGVTSDVRLVLQRFSSLREFSPPCSTLSFQDERRPLWPHPSHALYTPA